MSCSVDTELTPDREEYMWVEVANYQSYYGISPAAVPITNMTATVVTIVNTVLDTTSLVTEFPPEYTPGFNSLGTRIQEITYTLSGDVLSTFL